VAAKPEDNEHRQTGNAKAATAKRWKSDETAAETVGKIVEVILSI